MADLFGMIQNVDKPTFIHHQQCSVSEVHHNYNSPLPLLSTLLQQCPINDWLIEGALLTEFVNAKKFKQLKCHIRLLMPEHTWAWCWKFYGFWTKWPVRRKSPWLETHSWNWTSIGERFLYSILRKLNLAKQCTCIVAGKFQPSSCKFAPMPAAPDKSAQQ